MKKNILLIAVIAVLVLVLVKGTRIQSVEEYYLTHTEDIGEDDETVTISIRCDTLLQEKNWKKLDKQLREEKYVPSDGVILPETTCVLRKGDTAFDILKRVCRYKEIQMDYQGADSNIYSTAFIKGINYLYEFSCGDLSGWMYKVNGDFPNRGASSYKLKDGDVIDWVYTCDLGRDVGDTSMAGTQQKSKQTSAKEDSKSAETQDTNTQTESTGTEKKSTQAETTEAENKRKKAGQGS